MTTAKRQQTTTIHSNLQDFILTYQLYFSLPSGTYSYTSITVLSGGVITLLSNATVNPALGVTIEAQNVTVMQGGAITGVGTGYPGIHVLYWLFTY